MGFFPLAFKQCPVSPVFYTYTHPLSPSFPPGTAPGSLVPAWPSLAEELSNSALAISLPFYCSPPRGQTRGQWLVLGDSAFQQHSSAALTICLLLEHFTASDVPTSPGFLSTCSNPATVRLPRLSLVFLPGNLIYSHGPHQPIGAKATPARHFFSTPEPSVIS